MSEEFLPSPPAFLAGPAVVLLTNSGFSARVVMASAPTDHIKPVSGQLLVRGSKFFFEPRQEDGKQARTGRFSFIWNAATNQGYILSEALQGYAPIASTVRFTNLVVQSAQTTGEKIDGHPVEQSRVVVAASDGNESSFEVSRARDLAGLAICIASLQAPAPSTITLSQIRLEFPPEKLFLPPDDFTAYPNEEAMMTELAARQQAVRRGGREADGEGEHVGGGQGRHSRGSPDTGP
jgi:hypothetical protein